MANSAIRLLGLALATVTVPLVGACAHSDSPSAPAAATAAPVTTSRAPASRQAPEWHMTGKFELAEAVRNAVIMGDLQQARASAQRLVDSPAPKALPKDLKMYLARMRQQADDVVLAGNIAEAAQAVGRLGTACGNCHWRSNRGPNPDDTGTSLPWYDPPDDVGTRMLRHEIGLSQMWQGLIRPSIKAFRSGTVTLTRAPLTAPQGHDEPVDSGQHAAIEQIRNFAKMARTASTPAERAEIYGTMLTYCAVCHQVTPGGPS